MISALVAALAGFLAQLMHVALVVALAPLLVGFVRLVKARLMGRRGPPITQPWRDIRKLLRKRPVVAAGATAITTTAPHLACAASLLAAHDAVPASAVVSSTIDDAPPSIDILIRSKLRG